MRAETLHEGKYILKTDDEDVDATEAVGAYKELDTVESGFRDLKDVIEMPPVYHKTDGPNRWWDANAMRRTLQTASRRSGAGGVGGSLCESD